MTLFKTIDEFVKYVEANALTNLDTVMPSIRMAERAYLIPVISQAQYVALCGKYDADTLSEEEQQLLELCQEAVANIAMAIAVSRLAVQFSETGVRRVESSTDKSAFQYQEVNLRDSLSTAGFNALEDLLQFLEDNKDKFPLWAGSTSYSEYKLYFIQSGVQLSRYYDCKRSRLTYMRVRPIMHSVETFNVRDIIGKPLFNALKAGQSAGNLSNEYKQLLEDYINPGIALMTMAKAAVQRLVDITEEGITVSRLADYNNTQARDHAPSTDVDRTYHALVTEADEYFKRLGEELAANPVDYPDYEAPAKRSASFNITNKTENGIYGV